MRHLKSHLRIATLLLTAFVLLGALPAAAQEGELDPSQPTGITTDQIIQKFAAKEKEFAQARDNYTFRQYVTVQTLDGDTVDGEYQQVTDVTFDDQGRRRENVVFAPQSTLERVQMTEQDFDDIQHRYPFVLTTDEIGDYQILYVGKQKEDELHTYVFDVAPRKIEKNRRYFQGRIWVDDQDLQIVKTQGRPAFIRTDAQEFPSFTTYREQIDGKYWFPTYTIADEVLHFRGDRNNMGSDVHIRIKVKYTDYKQFKSKSRIIFNGQEVSRDPNAQNPQQAPPPEQQPPPPPK